MDWLKALYGLIAALPEILKLISSVQSSMKENEIQGKVSDGVKQVHESLIANDAEHLNRIFTIDLSK